MKKKLFNKMKDKQWKDNSKNKKIEFLNKTAIKRNN